MQRLNCLTVDAHLGVSVIDESVRGRDIALNRHGTSEGADGHTHERDLPVRIRPNYLRKFQNAGFCEVSGRRYSTDNWLPAAVIRAVESPSVENACSSPYLRVSTKAQAERGGEAEGFSIPAQREACLRKAEAIGVQVVAEFVDAGESARSAKRPELQNMLEAVAEHKISFVIVHKIDRLARNRADDIEINLKLKSAGSQLVSCSENIDETPSGQLVHGIMSSLAEFYSLNLAAEAKKGMLQKAKNGGSPGRAPFGYKNVIFRDDREREIRTVETDPERGTWVQWLYERYATGEWTTQMLAEELRALGVTRAATAKMDAKPIAVSQVASILMNRY
mgnify:CR=1 FL=1